MKKIFYIFALVAFTLASCNNKEDLKPSNQIEIERIKMNDTLFNKAKHTHDMLKNF